MELSSEIFQLSATTWNSICFFVSVFARGGICIWTASYPGSIAPVRSGISSFLVAPSGSTGARWALVDFLESPNQHPITSIAWNPSGRYPLYGVGY